MIDAGLVLEGGGMKGIYTAGVLDYFMEKGLFFKNSYGVSAGSCHLCSYISKQHGRAKRVSLDYLREKNYCSMYSLLTTGDMFHVKFCYDRIPNELDPYDYETALAYEGNAYAVVTNIETGKPEYMQLREMHKDIIAVRASSSLPLVSRNVEIDGRVYLDGGISDAIPIRKSVEDSNRKSVVVLTKEVGYVRKPASALGLVKAMYKKYPKVYELMRDRHITYNDTLEYLAKAEKEGQAFVIRPQRVSDVRRIEKDRAKLEALYDEGYADAKNCYDDMMRFLEQ